MAEIAKQHSLLVQQQPAIGAHRAAELENVNEPPGAMRYPVVRSRGKEPPVPRDPNDYIWPGFRLSAHSVTRQSAEVTCRQQAA